MKKILLFVGLCLSALLVFPQNQHLEFKGIPIDGNLSDFVSKMKEDGFTSQEYGKDNVAIMEGEFAGKHATVFILATSITKTVWKIAVNYKEKESWHSLKSEYDEMKKMYIKKYGTPEEDFHFFMKPYYEGDGYELQALRKEKCHYVSFYKALYGTVTLEITKFGYVQCAYEDGQNYRIKKEEEEAEVLNDI